MNIDALANGMKGVLEFAFYRSNRAYPSDIIDKMKPQHFLEDCSTPLPD
jgi:hypothetical protein